MKGRANRVMSASLGPTAFTYSIERGIELRLLKKAEYGAVVAKGYKGIVENAKVNDQGLVDIYSACEGLCVQASYDAYVNYPKAVNGNEAVAGFPWAPAIVEKPKAAKAK